MVSGSIFIDFPADRGVGGAVVAVEFPYYGFSMSCADKKDSFVVTVVFTEIVDVVNHFVFPIVIIRFFLIIDF